MNDDIKLSLELCKSLIRNLQIRIVWIVAYTIALIGFAIWASAINIFVTGCLVVSIVVLLPFYLSIIQEYKYYKKQQGNLEGK